MSVRVVSEVWRHSRAELGARLVLLALADTASDDGVTWIVQYKPEDDRCLTAKTLLGVRQIRNSLRALDELGEIEIRQAQRGRRRINVYRVTVGRIRDAGIDYARLPFDIDQPFTTGKDCRPSDPQASDPCRGNGLPEAPGDDRQGLPPVDSGTTGTLRHDDRHSSAGRIVKASVLEPSVREEGTNVPSSPAPDRRRARARDPFWDALAEACIGTVHLSRALGREVGVAAADLRAQGVNADDLPAIVAAYRKRFPGCEASASAIAKWAPVLRLTGTATADTRLERARLFVARCGREYADTPSVLREELATFKLDEATVDELVRIAAGTVVRSAA